jgi:hypothetical protein
MKGDHTRLFQMDVFFHVWLNVILDNSIVMYVLFRPYRQRGGEVSLGLQIERHKKEIMFHRTV